MICATADRRNVGLLNAQIRREIMSSSPLIRGSNQDTIAENPVLETTGCDSRRDTESPTLTRPHNHAVCRLLLAECSNRQPAVPDITLLLQLLL